MYRSLIPSFITKSLKHAALKKGFILNISLLNNHNFPIASSTIQKPWEGAASLMNEWISLLSLYKYNEIEVKQTFKVKKLK